MILLSLMSIPVVGIRKLNAINFVLREKKEKKK